jgi:hypothetical protein
MREARLKEKDREEFSAERKVVVGISILSVFQNM